MRNKLNEVKEFDIISRCDTIRIAMFDEPYPYIVPVNFGEEIEYSCAMKSHFRKIGNQMSGSGNHLCEFTRVMFYLDRIPLASICHVQHQCL